MARAPADHSAEVHSFDHIYTNTCLLISILLDIRQPVAGPTLKSVLEFELALLLIVVFLDRMKKV